MRVHDDSPSPGELIPITEVERQTGIGQSTLRMWEKRYGFPQPLRDRHGNRVYPAGQVERLQAVRRLIDQGERPGRIFSGTLVFDAAVRRTPSASRPPPPRHCSEVFTLLRAYRLSELHGLFQHRLLDLGLRRFVIDFLAPVSTEVGLAWSRGELAIRHEHMFSQMATSVLHARQATVRAAGDGRPRVVLAALSGESHTLGALMAEAVMASLGMQCFQLGADLPPQEVAAAARETGADIVALSFSAYFPRRSLVRMTSALRSILPSGSALWIGGEGTRGTGMLVAGIDSFDSLEDIEPALQRWRDSMLPKTVPKRHAL